MREAKSYQTCKKDVKNCQKLQKVAKDCQNCVQKWLTLASSQKLPTVKRWQKLPKVPRKKPNSYKKLPKMGKVAKRLQKLPKVANSYWWLT